MRPFDYYRVTNINQAISLLAKYQEKAAILAGGSDLLTLMKDNIEGKKMKVPQHLIDVKGIKDLNYVKEYKGGVKIGSAVTLSEMMDSALIGEKYPLLKSASAQVAVPQIRNVGTLGGNLCQRPRCWYFRGRLFHDCLRKGGGNCYAQDGENQYHAILGGEMCCMASLTDMGVALTALDAKVEIVSPKGNKTIPISKFYIPPEKNVLRETILTPQEMVVGVHIPPPASDGKGVYVKVRERQAFDFAIVSVAVNVFFKGKIVKDARIVFGGLAPQPWRSIKAEAMLKGKEVKDAVSMACDAAVEGARPLKNNGYKIQVAKGVLHEALAMVA